ncbi:MAG: hypothetical protein ORN85_05060 [Sediminibacterium sp.]|nr:hypothetical protein [Sediminibacterium sp.]
MSNHPLLTQPYVSFPSNHITQEEMIIFLKNLFPNYEDWELAERMIRNTEIDGRYLAVPLDELAKDYTWGERNEMYRKTAIEMLVPAVMHILDFNELTPKNIDMIILTSSTGFLMPSLIAYLFNALPFRSSTVQIPVAQMGCVAAAWAINRSVEYLKANPHHNVLILSAEFSSAVFQKKDCELHNLVSDSLFGDCVSGAVMKGKPKSGDSGYSLEKTATFFKHNSINYIKYDVKDDGFHFFLDKNVMHTVPDLVPVINQMILEQYQITPNQLDFYLFHTGGKRILESLSKELELKDNSLRHCKHSLRYHGNTISSVILDIFTQKISSQSLHHDMKGMLLAMGPGFTAEMSCGRWLVY